MFSSLLAKVDAMIGSNQLDDATIDVEVRRNWDEIISNKPVFDRREQSVSLCSTVDINYLSRMVLLNLLLFPSRLKSCES